MTYSPTHNSRLHFAQLQIWKSKSSSSLTFNRRRRQLQFSADSFDLDPPSHAGLQLQPLGFCDSAPARSTLLACSFTAVSFLILQSSTLHVHRLVVIPVSISFICNFSGFYFISKFSLFRFLFQVTVDLLDSYSSKQLEIQPVSILSRGTFWFRVSISKFSLS